MMQAHHSADIFTCGTRTGSCPQLVTNMELSVAASHCARWKEALIHLRQERAGAHASCRATCHSGYDLSCLCARFEIPRHELLEEVSHWHFKRSTSHVYSDPSGRYLPFFHNDVLQLVFQMAYTIRQSTRVHMNILVNRMTPIWVVAQLDSVMCSESSVPALVQLQQQAAQDPAAVTLQQVQMLCTLVGRLVNVQPMGFAQRRNGSFVHFLKIELQDAPDLYYRGSSQGSFQAHRAVQSMVQNDLLNGTVTVVLYDSHVRQRCNQLTRTNPMHIDP